MLRARREAILRSQRTKEDHFAQAIAFNEAVIRSPDAKWSDKLAAHRDNNELLGLYPPKPRALQGADGGPTTIIVRHAHEITADSVRPAVAQEELPE